MSLAQEDIEFIKALLGEWLTEQSLGKPPAVYEIELRERMVRVEEALKHQRELMREGFERMDQRFEQVDRRRDKVDPINDAIATSSPPMAYGFVDASQGTGPSPKLHRPCYKFC